jgi:hypothetical protein
VRANRRRSPHAGARYWKSGGRGSANVGKTCADKHKVIDWPHHRRHRPPHEVPTRMTRSRFPETSAIFEAHSSVCVIEVPWVQINEYGADTGFGQELARPIPTSRTLSATVNLCLSGTIGRHTPTLPKRYMPAAMFAPLPPVASVGEVSACQMPQDWAYFAHNTADHGIAPSVRTAGRQPSQQLAPLESPSSSAAPVRPGSGRVSPYGVYSAPRRAVRSPTS